MYIANTIKWQTFTVHTVHLLYKLVEIIKCQEQTVRLLVVRHHKNIHQLGSFRFLKLNLENQNIKMERTYEHLLLLSFMRLCSKSASCNSIPQLFLLLNSFFRKAAIIIAILGQKTLRWQSRKVILSDMCNCNFEAISYPRS